MGYQVMGLVPRETVRLDLDRLAEIYEGLADPAREDDVFRALSTLEMQIEAVDYSFSAGRFPEAGGVARRLIPVAAELGLTSVIAAAEAVVDTAAQRDGPGLAATVARLRRAAESSMGALTDPTSIPC